MELAGEARWDLFGTPGAPKRLEKEPSEKESGAAKNFECTCRPL